MASHAPFEIVAKSGETIPGGLAAGFALVQDTLQRRLQVGDGLVSSQRREPGHGRSISPARRGCQGAQAPGVMGMVSPGLGRAAAQRRGRPPISPSQPIPHLPPSRLGRAGAQRRGGQPHFPSPTHSPSSRPPFREGRRAASSEATPFPLSRPHFLITPLLPPLSLSPLCLPSPHLPPPLNSSPVSFVSLTVTFANPLDALPREEIGHAQCCLCRGAPA